MDEPSVAIPNGEHASRTTPPTVEQRRLPAQTESAWDATNAQDSTAVSEDPSAGARMGGSPVNLGAALSFGFVPKLQPPPPRAGDVPRNALVERLLTRHSENIIAIVAPPGYGKTTLMSQWSARQHRDVAWISLDGDDNDPGALLLDTAVAMARAGLVDPSVIGTLGSPADSIVSGLARLTPALTSMSRPLALVFDHVEAVDNPESLDLLNELAMRLPHDSRLAVGGRTLPPLPNALLRSRGGIVEVGVDELKMEADEASLLLERAGARTDALDVGWLVEQTEGWPAGLSLAALALRSGGQPPDGRLGVRGDDRLVGDYLRSEVLGHLDRFTVEFLTRTAILEHLSGPLCDAVRDSRGSQIILESLESAGLLLIPLDRHRGWYRYHRLFRELLLAELMRDEPDLVSTLHRRAADWLATNRMLERAIDHAQQAQDANRVAQLVTIAAQPAYATGRKTTARRWLEWFRSDGRLVAHPNVAVLGAILEALSGRPAASEGWKAAAEGSAESFADVLPDGSPIHAWLAYLRALTGRDGSAAMRGNAQAATASLSTASPFRAGALLLEGISYLLEGRNEIADPILARACDVGEYVNAAAATAAAFAQRALIAFSFAEWDRGASLAERGLDIIDRHHLGEYLEAAPVHTAVARAAIHAGDLPTARAHVFLAVRLRPLMSYAMPSTALFQLELARTHLQLGDVSGARTLLQDLNDNLSQQTGMGTLNDDANELRNTLAIARQHSIGASTLTVAELRVLPYLATHLSFREIGARLYVSQHTVKTQAIAIYRKLGVSSRSDAIDRAAEIGLLAR